MLGDNLFNNYYPTIPTMNNDLIKGGQSPNQLINAMAANNPEMQQYLTLLQSGTYKDAALAMARMKGITNPAQVEQMIQQYLKTRQ